MKKLTFILLVISCLNLFSANTNSKNQTFNSYGFGLIIFSKAYIHKDTEIFIIPSIRYNYKSFYINNIEFGYKLFNSKKHNFSIFLTPDFSGFNNDDSGYFQGMKKREKSLNLGLNYNFRFKFWNIETKHQLDILGKSKGFKESINLSYLFRLKKISIIPKLGLEYYNSKYTNYYYGIFESEVNETRDFYFAKSSLNKTISTSIFYQITHKKSFLFSVNYKLLGNSIKNSPLTDISYEFTIISGFSWKF